MKTGHRRRRRGFDIEWLLAAAAWIAIVLVVNSTPSDGLPKVRILPLPPHFDKVVHFGMYGLMAVMLWNAATPRRRTDRPWVRPWIAATVLPAVIAAADELHQTVVPGRSADWLDLVADWLAVAVVVAMGRFRSRR